MNIFNRENIDWETLVSQLLWFNVVSHKNEYSGYDIITKYKTLPLWCNGDPELAYQRGYKPGDILRDTSFLSYYVGPVRKLTWKELALVLGFWKEQLLPDYHNCSICQQKDKCYAYFKDDPEQERCSGWMKDHGHPNDEEEYKKFIDNILSLNDLKNIELTEEEKQLLDKLIKSIEAGETKINFSEEELKEISVDLDIPVQELKDTMKPYESNN